jgi:hypothetical protein
MWGTRNSHRFLAEMPEGKKPLGRPRHRWEGNINIGLGKTRWDGMNRFICLRIGTRALENMVKNLCVPQNDRIYLNS